MTPNEWMQKVVKGLLIAATEVFKSKYLIYTNTSTAAFTFIVGDYLTQRYEQLTDGEPKGFNFTRSANMGIAGVLNGFMFHHWYRFLDTKLPGTCIRTVIKKTVLDMLIGSNLSIMCLFAAQAALENGSFEQFLDDVRNGWFPVYVSDLMLWPATQFINFYYLKPKYRLVFVNLVTLVASVYRSHIAHEVQEKHNKGVKQLLHFLYVFNAIF